MSNAPISLKRIAPVQGQKSVAHHFAQYQHRFLSMLQPRLLFPEPSHLHPFCTEDKLCKELLSYTLELSIPFPPEHPIILGFWLPQSQTTYFTQQQDYARSEQCHYCNADLNRGAILTPLLKGAVWSCGCHLNAVDLQYSENTLHLLDWWHHPGWWQSLFSKYVTKEALPPFCSMLLFVAMAQRLIEVEGFKKSSEPHSTRERLRALWRNDALEPGPDDPVLKQMVCDALHPERWPASIEKAKSIALEAKQSRNANWREKVEQATSSAWVDLRDNMKTGVLCALPVSSHLSSDTTSSQSQSQAFGSLKQRGWLKLKLTQKQEYSDRKFPIVRFTFRDDAKRTFRWDASLPSAPDVNVNTWYYLQGTIREHVDTLSGVITQLYRCADFKEVGAEAAIPDFLPTAKSTAKRDVATLTWQLHDVNGRIDGKSYAQISRVWIEDDIQRSIDVVSAWPFDDATEKSLVQAMQEIGLQREGYSLDKKKDKSLLRILADHAPPTEFTGSIVGHWIDDAYAHTSETHLNETARDGASPSERQWRKPHWFFESSQAQSHARRLTMGRWLTVEIKHPVLVYADLSLRGSPSYPDFISAARKRGANFLLGESGSAPSPLTLSGAIILKAQHEHASWPNQAHYTLKGKNILIVPHLSGYSTALMKNQLRAHPAGLERNKPGQLSVRDIVLNGVESSRDAWFYANVDNVTTYYLRRLGCRCWVVGVNNTLDTGDKLIEAEIPPLDPHLNTSGWTQWLSDLVAFEAETRRMSV